MSIATLDMMRCTERMRNQGTGTEQILIENGAILTMNRAGDIHWPGWVLVAGDKIDALGPGAAPAAVRAQAGRVIDATNMAVLPGLVNAHTHLSQTFMRGLGDDKTLLQWLKQVMWPLQAAMTPADMRLASLLGLIETEFVDPKVAYEAAPNVDELKMRLKGISASRAGLRR